MRRISTPLTEESVESLKVGDMVTITGNIYCGRDAVLPKIRRAIETGEIASLGIDLEGSVVFHTAVSPAGIGPTSSNKLEIENSMPALAKAGVRIHLGKGCISEKTIQALNKYNSRYAIIPPVTALLSNNTLQQRVVAFSELGMEAFYELEVVDVPIIIAAANGESIY